MDAVARGFAIYFLLLLLLRVTGKRGLAQITTFDFVLLLIIAEATQQALLGDDLSVTNGVIVIATLIAIDIGLSLVKERLPRVARVIDSVPVVLVEDGRVHRGRMAQARIDESDLLSSARELQGLERLDQIKHAVLEQSGGISIVPK